MGGLQAISMPPPAVVSSTAGITGLSTASYQTSVGQSRVIPGMINLPSGLDASLRQTTRIQPLSGAGGGEVEHLQKQLNSIFPAENFEPTPINPNLQLRVRGEMRDHESTSTSKSQGSVVASRGIERADSLTFDNLFARDQGSATGKAAKMGGNSSNHLSAMSFSIGDMSDATNLSAVFEDSMRISDDAPKRLSMSDYAAKKRSISPHGGNVGGGIASAKQGHASTMDMSTQTFGQDDLHGATGSLGSSMFNMSFRSKD